MDVIHIVIGKANPNRMNGVNRVVHQLANRQALSGRNVQIWGLSVSESDEIIDRAVPTRVFKVTSGFGVGQELRKAINQLEGDHVFHLHGAWIPVFHSLVKIFVKEGHNYVLTPHGGYNEIAMKKSKWKKRLYQRMFETFIVKNASVLHCIGQSESEKVVSWVDNLNFEVVPYGFELENLEHPGQSDDRYLDIAFCGRIDIHTKGLDIILEALSKVAHLPIRLHIIGDGGEIRAFKKMVDEKQLKDQLVFHGKQFGQDKYKILQSCDVFIHASRNEGLPTAVLEAASVRLPVIVTQATNVAGYVEKYHSGWTMENESIEELVQILEIAFSDFIAKSLDEKGDNAYKMVSEAFHWDVLLDEFDQLYQYAS